MSINSIYFFYVYLCCYDEIVCHFASVCVWMCIRVTLSLEMGLEGISCSGKVLLSPLLKVL